MISITHGANPKAKLHQTLPHKALTSSTPQTYLCSLLHFLPNSTQLANCQRHDLLTDSFMPTPPLPTMPKDKQIPTARPIAVLPITSKAYGQSGMDGIRPDSSFVITRLTCNHRQGAQHGPIATPSTPHKDGVGNAEQQASTSQAPSTAIATQHNRETLIDEAITEACARASTSATDSHKKSKSAKSKGVADGGSSRKRDHDTMANASRLASAPIGGSAAPSSSKNPGHAGDNSLQANKFQRILPKGPGQGVQGQCCGGPPVVVNDPAQPDPNPCVSWGQAAPGANQTPGEALPVPFLSGQVLAWLPTSLRVAANSARTYVQTLVNADEEWHRKFSSDKVGTHVGIMMHEGVLQMWDATLRGLVEVATAAREGRQLDHKPMLQNDITIMLRMKIPDPDQPHGDKQFTHEPPTVSTNMEPGHNDASSPIVMGMGPAVAGSGQVVGLSEEIDTVIRMSSRNESVRHTQNARLHSLLVSQTQAHAQGFQDLQAAHRRADEARASESDMIFTMIKKRSELLEKKEG